MAVKPKRSPYDVANAWARHIAEKPRFTGDVVVEAMQQAIRGASDHLIEHAEGYEHSARVNKGTAEGSHAFAMARELRDKARQIELMMLESLPMPPGWRD